MLLPFDEFAIAALVAVLVVVAWVILRVVALGGE